MFRAVCNNSETGALCVSAAAHTEIRLQQNEAVEHRGGTVCFKSEPKQQNTEECIMSLLMIILITDQRG